MNEGSVAAVVVTWNRRTLLVEALRAIEGQSRPPHRVIVVDNASHDGTRAMLANEFAHLDVISVHRNTGGAGGFAIGLQRALSGGCDAVWLLDDDTIPEPGALAALVDARHRYGGAPPALVASRVVWTDGRDHPMNTPREKPGVSATERAAAATVGGVAIRSASFVSVLVDASLVRERGLPVADYFLWNDDFEFTTRLIRGRRGIFCPASVVVHKTSTFGSTEADPGARFFYEVRNKVWLFARSRGLSPVEKVVYGASTVRRWGRTIARSHDRATLWRGLQRGLVAGFRTRPRSTTELIAAATCDRDVW
ncbi:MAG: glycosyltransferase family 2 protein [Propionibacteriales bacterium]|nr:glycosyltransferase family 2 protein [Propionibacteriales bacterium]